MRNDFILQTWKKIILRKKKNFTGWRLEIKTTKAFTVLSNLVKLRMQFMSQMLEWYIVKTHMEIKKRLTDFSLNF